MDIEKVSAALSGVNLEMLAAMNLVRQQQVRRVSRELCSLANSRTKGAAIEILADLSRQSDTRAAKASAVKGMRKTN